MGNGGGDNVTAKILSAGRKASNIEFASLRDPVAIQTGQPIFNGSDSMAASVFTVDRK